MNKQIMLLKLLLISVKNTFIKPKNICQSIIIGILMTYVTYNVIYGISSDFISYKKIEDVKIDELIYNIDEIVLMMNFNITNKNKIIKSINLGKSRNVFFKEICDIYIDSNKILYITLKNRQVKKIQAVR